MKVTLGITLALVFLTRATQAAAVTLDFTSLPSAQGWTYLANGLAESSVFAVDGTTLTENLLGTVNQYAHYRLTNVINPALSFSLSMRARVLANERNASPNGGGGVALELYAIVGGRIFGIGLNTNTVNRFPFGAPSPVDGTQFHNYRLEVMPAGVASIFLDDTLLLSYTAVAVANPSENFLGFGSGAEEPALVQINQFSFVQPSEPRPELRISRFQDTGAQITWATNFSGYTLESAPALPATVWNTVTNIVVPTGKIFSVTVDTTPAFHVFRLRKP